jgi:hypothetical protein
MPVLISKVSRRALDAPLGLLVHFDRHSTAEIADMLGAPREQFTAWMRAMTVATTLRPDAVCGLLRHRDLRAAGPHPPVVVPADILRRQDALQPGAGLD